MRELSVSEQRYQAVLAVISDGEGVTEGRGTAGELGAIGCQHDVEPGA